MMGDLSSLLQELAGPFEIEDILQPEHLGRCAQTGYAFTAIPGVLSLAVTPKYFGQAAANENVCALVCQPVNIQGGVPDGKTVIVSRKASDLFYHLHNLGIHLEAGAEQAAGPVIHPSAEVHPSCVLGKGVVVAAGVRVMSGCFLGDNVRLGENTVVYPQCVIGAPGVFAKKILGKKMLTKQYGGVKIGENCVLHARATVAQAVNYRETTNVGDEVHIGFGTIVGHDCDVGNGTTISSHAVISGRAQVGVDCWIGVGAIISDSIRVGDGASVRIGSVVIRDVAAGEDVSGYFATNHHLNLRRFMAFGS